MLQHVVLIRWKAEVSEAQIARVREKAQILRGIEGIEHVALHPNLGVALPHLGRGIGAVMVVAMRDRATLDRYAPHPLHAELGAVLMPAADEITIVDYETQ